ncbi:MAG: DUF484 family protein [Nitrospinae bacterium]|nr:DUF484 family protein [Nitrospinota bacterium]
MKQDLASQSLKMNNVRLRESVASLSKKLKFLINCSEENEIKDQRVEEMEEIIFTSGSLKEMFDTLITQGRQIFGLDAITVTLDTRFENGYPEGYKEPGVNVFINSGNVFFAELMADQSLVDLTEPRLRRGKKGSETFFPNGLCMKVRSEALLPVRSAGGLLAVVAFGSSIPTRFNEGDGVRYLKRLARLLALKMDNFAARYERVEQAAVVESVPI